MTDAKECCDRFQDIVALVLEELDVDSAKELQDHIAVCEQCKETLEVLRDEERQIRSSFEALARGLSTTEHGSVWTQETKTQVSIGVNNNHFGERMKMMILTHKRLSFVAASTITAAASLFLYIGLFSMAGDAYALQQTLQANDQVRSYHVRVTPAKELGEAWIEVNADGTPRRARMSLTSRDDGAKVVVLTGDRAEVWFKDKKSHIITTAKEALNNLMAKRAIFDPKFAFEQLQAQKEAGKVQVVAQEATEEGEPIRLTVTFSDKPDRRALYEVDSRTKLVMRVTEFQRNGDQWTQVGTRDYLDYNKPIDSKMFQLDLPPDVVTIDRINQKAGLAKGSLSDQEIATKLAKEFFGAMIAEDFEKAGMIYSGIPGEALRQRFEQAGIKILRLVEVGTPSPHAKTQALQVPVRAELDVKGEVSVTELLPLCRQVHGQPERWQIIGGI